MTEIFADIGKDRLTASRKVLGYLKRDGSAKTFADAARRLIFLKGNNSHDYKFSAAVLEDYGRLGQPWRDRLLASSVFYLRGSADADNDLVRRTRAALKENDKPCGYTGFAQCSRYSRCRNFNESASPMNCSFTGSNTSALRVRAAMLPRWQREVER